MVAKLDENQADLGAIFDAHVKHEFIDQDLDATMATMTDDPYVHHVASATGGVGREGVRNFYKTQFIGKWPADVKVTPVSRAVAKDSVIDEMIITFTHDIQMDFMIPGVAPTGKKVELPVVVIMKFVDGKIAYEHIYWDQGSVLAQIGFLDPQKIPVLGKEQATRLMELVARNENKSAG